MQTPLTTFDGYPRDDIDVAQIRTTRARIIPLVNDVKALMIEIEKALHAHHAEPTGTSTSADSSSTSAAPPTTAPQTETPVIEAVFAVVDQVSPSSPAEQAGVQVGDKVKRFGSVGALNHEKLAKVAAEVQQNENVRPSSFPQLHAACRLVGRVFKLTTTTHAYYSANHIGSGVPCDWRWGAGSGAAVDTSTGLGWSRDAGMPLASIIIVPPCRLAVASFGCIGTPVVFLDRTGLA
ncbi:putative 26S proteasome regulatory subunit, variant 3 [Orbilia oligospora]|uniref:Putative 26S proteasome regulatory subunit, variant 3 n=1 Tax=Orbilia oligospora TaxID=2813651 RepID=A0A7C8NFJ1_ORBOL|nr:putative 26S proteasome regulatory subunit, variant 3 [Orbilia oligospora]KAF3097338.1 putative 26S proteasome regulatory subunit, variant 3 [Orbilia oligospora]KAF3135605.1 putative 26S proteasome regulatory subunit, variant 3 [Orbilia oligospora]